jgi:hypothetical protein
MIPINAIQCCLAFIYNILYIFMTYSIGIFLETSFLPMHMTNPFVIEVKEDLKMEKKKILEPGIVIFLLLLLAITPASA